MPLPHPARAILKKLLLDRYTDWAAFRTAMHSRQLSLSQSSVVRFLNGQSNSPRAFRVLCHLLESSPEDLTRRLRVMAEKSPHAEHPLPGSSAQRFQNTVAYQIAYQLWVEMHTRKIGLPINPAEDLVLECYDSWYAFFEEARKLMRAIPLHENPDSSELHELVELFETLLNCTLRPHLQCWHARFRHWHHTKQAQSLAMSAPPQMVQQAFPEWKSLLDQLLLTNRQLTEIADNLGRRTFHARTSRGQAEPSLDKETEHSFSTP